MLETPDASPTWCADTEAVAADDAGPFDRPIPTATAISGRTNAPYLQSDWATPTTAKPTAVMANPAATTIRPVNFAASLGTSGAVSTRPTVAGRVASPACNGEKPSATGSWKYRLSRYIRALIVPAPMRITSVDPTR